MTTDMKHDLAAISDATDYDGTDRFNAELRRVCETLPKYEGGDAAASDRIDGLEQLVDHLAWLLNGRLQQVQTLTANIHNLCPRELAAQIVQD